MRSLFRTAIDAFAAIHERRQRERLIRELDERTLRDIGLDHEANHARDRARAPYMRFGMY